MSDAGYRRAKADLELQEANKCHERRELNWYFDDDGMVVVKVRLTPEDGAHFIDAIERATKELKAQQGEEVVARAPFASTISTALPDWDDVAMDRAMAIDDMFTASGYFQVRRTDVTAETTPGDT